MGRLAQKSSSAAWCAVWFRPASLARYSARSARSKTVSGLSPASARVSPMLTETVRDTSRIGNSSVKDSWILAAIL